MTCHCRCAPVSSKAAFAFPSESRQARLWFWASWKGHRSRGGQPVAVNHQTAAAGSLQSFTEASDWLQQMQKYTQLWFISNILPKPKRSHAATASRGSPGDPQADPISVLSVSKRGDRDGQSIGSLRRRVRGEGPRWFIHHYEIWESCQDTSKVQAYVLQSLRVST